MDSTAAERACFEAGIKFGTLYHQFAGTPVSPDSAASLAGAMEEAIENQPFCESVEVTVLEDELREAVAAGPDEDGGYAELTGRFMEVAIEVEREGVRVRSRMELEDGYPLMRIADVDR